jgi:hypothetical protein
MIHIRAIIKYNMYWFQKLHKDCIAVLFVNTCNFLHVSVIYVAIFREVYVKNTDIMTENIRTNMFLKTEYQTLVRHWQFEIVIDATTFKILEFRIFLVQFLLFYECSSLHIKVHGVIQHPGKCTVVCTDWFSTLNSRVEFIYGPTCARPILLLSLAGLLVSTTGLQMPLACWDCGFESRWRHGCLSLVSVVYCQVQVSATGWSLIQRLPTGCSVSLCVIYKPRTLGGPGLRWAVVPETKTKRMPADKSSVSREYCHRQFRFILPLSKICWDF